MGEMQRLRAAQSCQEPPTCPFLWVTVLTEGSGAWGRPAGQHPLLGRGPDVEGWLPARAQPCPVTSLGWTLP